ncbi:hypothetical protein N2K95_11840 [Arthrobacter zhaoxinii]|uniref:ABC transporter permease n=1 Tax=Arthrobacter zhaoxinii TaxID=2964616 RepID=A0ABY5YQM6_9MICC|nr:hypothetical protein [Arthrobacter zhaoxinii]UWX96349.1 hypothetical protein N2K95_11840 [Arthrobacter zhaoxinii]
MNRAVAVARMQLTNKWIYLWIPLIILASSTLISLAIFAMIPDDASNVISGSGQAVMWYFFALGIQAMTLLFPFSQALSVSRRAFYIGTIGLFSLVALALAVLYWVLGLVEQATDGWGMKGAIFAIPWIAEGAWYTQILFYFAVTILLFLLGFWSSTIYKRWRTIGLTAALVGAGAVLLGVIALITWREAWASVGAWIVQLTPLSLAGWLLAAGALLALTSYATLRRAVP